MDADAVAGLAHVAVRRHDGTGLGRIHLTLTEPDDDAKAAAAECEATVLRVGFHIGRGRIRRYRSAQRSQLLVEGEDAGVARSLRLRPIEMGALECRGIL